MTQEEKIKEVYRLKKEGFSLHHISNKLNIKIDVVKNYIVLYKKKENSYNLDHVGDKYELNDEFFQIIKPKSILDAFCGRRRFWADYQKDGCNVVSNDSMQDENACPDNLMTLPANQLLEVYKLAGTKFDIVDIDPYGSPVDYLKAATTIAEKGLIITFGEFKSIRHRFKNRGQKYFKEKYGITKSFEDITINDIADSVIKLSNNKFKVWRIGDWKNCDRIYFIAK